MLSYFKPLLFLLLICVQSHAQLLVDKVMPPSANAAALIKYCDHPVGVKSGIPEVTFPLEPLTHEDILIPLSMSYHNIGIKVEEEATWTGLGWHLNAGGVITRIVRGKNDFGLTEKEFKSKAKGYPFEHIKPCFDDCAENENDAFREKVCNGEVDSDPDIFFFDLMGIKGKFLLTPDHRGDAKSIFIKTVSPTNLIFEYVTTTNSWKVKNEMGYTFFFKTREKTETHRNYFDYKSDEQKVLFNYYSELATSAWYLDEVLAPSGARAFFRYDTYPNGDSPYSSNGTHHKMFVNDDDVWDVHYSAYCFPKDVNNVQILSESLFGDIYLKSIRCGEYKVNFIKSDREDIISPAVLDRPRVGGTEYSEFFNVNKGPQKLDAMEIIKNGQLVKKYEFNYSYFNDFVTLGLPRLYKRLKLESIKTIYEDGVAKEDSFSYIEKFGLPSKESHARDLWGYYNGEENIHNMTPSDYFNYSQPEKMFQEEGREKHYSLKYAKEGILKMITYDDGSTKEFLYNHQEFTAISVEISDHFDNNMESSNFTHTASPYIAGGLRVQKIIERNLGVEIFKEFDYRRGNKESGVLSIIHYDHDHNGFGHRTSGNHNVIYNIVNVNEIRRTF